MWRVVLVLLVLANVGFFAWRHGTLEPLLPRPAHGERQPQRLAEQVNPEAVTVLGVRAASAAVTAARAASMAAGEGEQCIEIGPFAWEAPDTAAPPGSAPDADFGSPGPAWATAEAMLIGVGLPPDLFRRRIEALPAQAAVVLGPYVSIEARAQRAEELRQRGITATPEPLPPTGTPGLVLARHEGLAAAEASLPEWVGRGVRNVRALELQPGARQAWMRLERSRGPERDRVRGLRFPDGAALRNCPAAR